MTTVKSSGAGVLKRDAGHIVAAGLGVAAAVNYCVLVPGVLTTMGLENFSHFFANLMLALLPVMLTMVVAFLGYRFFSKWVRHCGLWSWVFFAFSVMVVEWAVFMAIILLSLFVFPVTLLDQLAGAMFYYMVPLCGAQSSLVLAAAAALVLQRKCGAHDNEAPWWLKGAVLAIFPASFAVYWLFNYLLYVFIPS